MSNRPDVLGVALNRGIRPYAIEVVTGKRYFRIRSVEAIGSGLYEVEYPWNGTLVTAVINGIEVVSVETDAE